METTYGGSSMRNKDRGGCAFPNHPDMAARLGCINSESDAGMTLRDYFAAKAMQVILRSYDIASSFEDSEVNDPEGMPILVAIDAYVMADAMLKARER
jgi:hypothetical protein